MFPEENEEKNPYHDEDNSGHEKRRAIDLDEGRDSGCDCHANTRESELTDSEAREDRGDSPSALTHAIRNEMRSDISNGEKA